MALPAEAFRLGWVLGVPGIRGHVSRFLAGSEVYPCVRHRDGVGQARHPRIFPKSVHPIRSKNLRATPRFSGEPTIRDFTLAVRCLLISQPVKLGCSYLHRHGSDSAQFGLHTVGLAASGPATAI